jgi:hypothetical protein
MLSEVVSKISDMKKKKVGTPAYQPSPFENAMSSIREVMFDLDVVTSSVN